MEAVNETAKLIAQAKKIVEEFKSIASLGEGEIYPEAYKDLDKAINHLERGIELLTTTKE